MRKFITIGLLCTWSVMAQENDSLTYATMRNDIADRNDHVVERYLSAAHELAELGMYTEAVEILRSAQSEQSGTSPTGEKPEGFRAEPEHHWVISAGTDYLRIEDLGSLDTLDSQTRDSLSRLRESPLTAYTRAEMEHQPVHPAISTLRPSVYFSNRHARFGLTSGFRFLDNRLEFAAEANAQKSLSRRHDARISFVGTRADSQDLVESKVSMALVSDRDVYTRSYRVPVEIRNSHYRNGTLGYRSYVSFAARPQYELSGARFGKSIGAGAEYLFKDYYQVAGGGTPTPADSLDFHRILLRTWGRFRRDRSSGALRFSYENEYRPTGYRPRRRQGTRSVVQARFAPSEHLSLALSASHLFTHETIGTEAQTGKDSLVARTLAGIVIGHDTIYAEREFVQLPRKGHELQVEPSIILEFDQSWKAGLSLGITRLQYPAAPLGEYRSVTVSRYIRPSSDEFRPRLEISYSSPSVLLRFAPHAVFDHVTDTGYETTDSRGAGASVSVDWETFSWLSISSSFDFTRKTYAPFGKQSPKTTDISAFLTAIMQWQAK